MFRISFTCIFADLVYIILFKVGLIVKKNLANEIRDSRHLIPEFRCL